MKMNKITVSAALAALVFMIAGCGGETGVSVSGNAASSEGSTEGYTAEYMPGTATSEGMTAMTTTPEGVFESDGQNPIMNYVGAYSDENGKPMSLLVQATDEENGVYFTVGFAEGAEYYIWDIYGKMESNVIKYTQGGCYKLVADPEAENGVREETVYEDGTGTFVITEENKITWTDDKENKGEGVVFAWDEDLNTELQQNASTGMN